LLCTPSVQASLAQGTIGPLSTAQSEVEVQAGIIAAQATRNAGLDRDLTTAQAAAAARATEVAALQAKQANAQVTATALAVVAANSVLDPNRQAITIQTDLPRIIHE
jgi:hypothetical protein